MNTYTIHKTIFISAFPERVFDALTNSDEIIKYFPLNEVISDWRIGSEVLYKGEVNGQEFTELNIAHSVSPRSG